MPAQPQPKLFKYRHFEASLILLCVRWFLKYSLGYRDLEEMMIEQDHRLDRIELPYSACAARSRVLVI